MIHTIKDNVYYLIQEIRKTVSVTLISTISVIAIAIFYLYNRYYHSSNISSIKAIDLKSNPILTKVLQLNKDAVQKRGPLLKILFCGACEDQKKITAENMAKELGIQFHYFDGRENNADKLRSVMKRISSSRIPELVYVSHAEELDRPQLETILINTGSVSEKLLFCIGTNAKDRLGSALLSRFQITVPI